MSYARVRCSWLDKRMQCDTSRKVIDLFNKSHVCCRYRMVAMNLIDGM